MAGIIAKRAPKVLPQGDKAEKLKPPSRAKGSRTRLPRVSGVVTKPKALKPGSITSGIENRNRNVIKEISKKINKAEQRFRQLSRAQREIDYKRSNPIGGKAFRSQATKRLNQEQRKLDKSKGKVYSAIELNYKPKRDEAYNVLAQIERAAKAFPQATVSRTQLPSKSGVLAKPKALKPGAPNKAIQTFRPGHFKRLKTMQGVSYGKSAEKQARLGNNFRPGEFYRGNFRPRNVTAKPVKDQNPFLLGKGNIKYKTSASNDDKAARLTNVETAQNFFESKGLKVTLKSNRNSTSVASYNPVTKDININRSHSYWINPASAAKHSRAKGNFSSSSPTHVLYHELGHAKDKTISSRIGLLSNMWILATRQEATQGQRVQRATKMKEVARRVSKYATANPSEFIAETYAGRRTGRKYDYQVMDAYREAADLPPLRLRNQKPRRRKPKP